MSLGLALLEFDQCGGAVYAARVIDNSRLLARLLQERGLPVQAAERGFTAGHQLWLRPALVGVDARVVGERLYQAGVRVNVLDDLPRIPEPALRIGVNEPTWLGLGPNDLEELAEVFTAAVFGKRATALLRTQVAALRRRTHSPYQFPIHQGPVGELVDALLDFAMTSNRPPVLLDDVDGTADPCCAQGTVPWT